MLRLGGNCFVRWLFHLVRHSVMSSPSHSTLLRRSSSQLSRCPPSLSASIRLCWLSCHQSLASPSSPRSLLHPAVMEPQLGGGSLRHCSPNLLLHHSLTSSSNPNSPTTLFIRSLHQTYHQRTRCRDACSSPPTLFFSQAFAVQPSRRGTIAARRISATYQALATASLPRYHDTACLPTSTPKSPSGPPALYSCLRQCTSLALGPQTSHLRSS